jgi:hypothetical protein
MGKPMYNFGKTASLKAQQQKQMDRDLRRRVARQHKPNIKSNIPNNKDSVAVESIPVADSAEGTA